MSEDLVAAHVPRNLWTELSPPEARDWVPSRSVAVVLPYFESPVELSRTLAALAVQDYPSDLYQAVIVDDGSASPLELSDTPTGLSVAVIHQEDRGFGLARARNTGAAATDAEILIFLDSDMVPELDWLRAHAIWHHTVSDALVGGFRRHVDFGSKTPEEVGEAVRRSGLMDMFEGEEVQEPEWIDFHMARTKNLAGSHDDGFRAITGGNLSIRADLFSELGGFDESFTRWGAEDTEFAYRSYVGGAMLIPQREAMAWHQGRGATPDESEQASLAIQADKIVSLIAHPSFRPSAPPRTYLVPRIAVTVNGLGKSVLQVVASVDSLLSSNVVDLAVVVETDGPQTEHLRERYRGESRVAVAEPGSGESSHPAAWARLAIPAGSRVGSDSIGRILDALDEVGLIRIDLSDGGNATAMLTRAWRRAKRSADHGEWEILAERWFGARTIAWQDAGFLADADWKQRPGLRGRLTNPRSRVGKIVRYLAGARSPGDLFRIFGWMARRARRRITG